MEQKLFEPVSRHLYRLACEAYLRCLEAEAQKTEKVKQTQAELETCRNRLQDDDRELQKECDEARLNLMTCKAIIQPGAVTAVILSVATLEGFINELTEYSHWHNPDWEAWGTILHESEQRHVSIKPKYLLAAYVTGQPFDKGALPYQDFSKLVKLRNALVHPRQLSHLGEDGLIKPSEIVEQVLVRIIGGAAFNSRYQHSPPGYNEICWTAVAKWACNTASEMIHAILDKLSAGGTKEAFEIMFCKWPDGQDCFQPVE